MTPLSRSMAKLRAEGWLVAKTEHWNSFARRRVDLFGFADLIAIRGNQTLAVQATSGPHVSARIEKIKATQAAAVWLESPTRTIVVHGWRKLGARGKRKVWEVREENVALPISAEEQALLDQLAELAEAARKGIP